MGVTTAQLAGLRDLLLALGALWLGSAVTRALLGKRCSYVMAVALALPGFVLYCLVLTLVNFVAGGAILSNRLAVGAITAVALIGVTILVFTRRTEQPTASRSDWLAMGTLVVAATLVWGLPVFVRFPLYYEGDLGLHQGWMGQFLDGSSLPGSSIVGEVPNYYPWLFHAVGAILVSLSGTHGTLEATGILQVLTSVGMVLGLYGLGRTMTGSPLVGFLAGILGGIGGGLGFLLAGHPQLLKDPRGPDPLRFWGDLIWKRPYAYGFENLAPPFPRDLAYALVPSVFTLLLLSLQEARARVLLSTGIVLGLVLLVNDDSLPVCLATIIVLLLFRPRRLRNLSLVLIPAVALWALWLVPLILNFFRLGGFIFTANPDATLPPFGIVGAYGIMLPLGAIGLIAGIRRLRSSPGIQVALLMGLAALAAVAIAPFIPRLLGEGFATLGLGHRYIPFAGLSLALLAALGAARVITAVRGRPEATTLLRRTSAIAVAAFVCLFALGSPIFGSLGFLQKFRQADLFVRDLAPKASAAGKPTLLTLLAQRMGAACTVADPPNTSYGIFAYTGFSQLVYTRQQPGVNLAMRYQDHDLHRALPEYMNLARVRFRDFTRVAQPDRIRLYANRLLTEARVTKERWDRVARRWGIDGVVVPRDRIGKGPLRGRDVIVPRARNGGLALIWLHRCPTA